MNLTTFTFETDADGIAVATFDLPGKSMNTITGDVMEDLATIAKELETNDDIKGLVITSGKASGFCAGADLGEIGGQDASALKDMSEDERLKAAFERAFSLNKTLRAIETCGKPVACAVNGLALGGGFEIALACHARFAANDNPKLVFGLPESKVGLLPGGGGTQRLPRLIGLMGSSSYILEGKNMKPQEALGFGIVKELVPTAELVTKAKEWVKANPNAKAPWDEKGFRFPGGVPNQKPEATQISMVGNAMVMSKTWGNYPAQKNILKCLYEGSQVPMDAALRIETRYFVETMQTPESKGMIRSLFLSLQELSKGASRPVGPAPYEIKKVAVLGAGLMGAGIAHVQAMAGIETVLLDISQESAEKGKAYSKRILDKAVSRGKMTQEKADKVLANITPSTDYANINGADLVVEAVFEDTELKAKVTKMAEEHLREDAVMGSNTSTLPITGLAKASVRPENYIGIHFFSPVERMGLVEIILGDKTSEETLAKTIDYVLKIKKTPITVNDHRGFYTSRCFGTYTQEGMEMLIEGIKPAIIENVGRMSGMPMGPLEVSDSVGLDTALKIGRQYAKAAGVDANEQPSSQFLAWLVEDKERVGRKAGKGYYEYDEKGKPSRIWPDLSDRIEVKVDECPPALKEELTKRFLFRQCIEVARCFEEGVITDARDADIGSILAWGFAPYSGGCASYMDLKWGIPAFVAEADRLADAYGERFRPPQMLRDMAEAGETFYSRFPPPQREAEAA
ncbi:MAG: 3-hydroxyacyl-CoA dehydrogenase [Ponticaulis sp.]|nr:3-hydroxyacyl-CoA dehydrogenase [Ponticaulis sp.]